MATMNDSNPQIIPRAFGTFWSSESSPIPTLVYSADYPLGAGIYPNHILRPSEYIKWLSNNVVEVIVLSTPYILSLASKHRPFISIRANAQIACDLSAMSYTAYVFHRSVLYALLWTASVVELGLTGWRVHHTKSTTGHYDPIVVELLVTSVLSILWVPVTLVFHVRKSKDLHPGSGYSPLGIETGGNSILWIMWLVGGAIATNKWPTKAIAGPGKDGHILLTIVAFSWICFGVLSLAKFITGLHFAALRGGEEASHGRIQEKPAGGAA